MSAVTGEVTAFQYRSIDAARRRVAVAREKAQRFPSEENRLAVAEFEAGLARMEGFQMSTQSVVAESATCKQPLQVAPALAEQETTK